MRADRILLMILLLPATGFAEPPDWATGQGGSDRYPESLYLTGWGMAIPSTGEDRAATVERASNIARANLARKIRVTIRDTVLSRVEEHGTDLSEYFKGTTETTSTLEVQGLEWETAYDGREKAWYALACAGRDRLTALYEERTIDLMGRIRSHLESGKSREDAGEPTGALAEYLACYPLFRQLEEARAILAVSRTAASAVLATLAGSIRQDEVRQDTVRAAVDRLLRRPIRTPEDLAWYLATCLKEQADVSGQGLMVAPFSYQDSRIAGSFSRYFKGLLEAKVREVAGWTVVQPGEVSQPGTRGITRSLAEGAGASCVLAGQFWEQVGGIKALATLRRLSDGAVLAGAEAQAPDTILSRMNLSLRPPNYDSARKDQIVFQRDEVVGQGLSLEVWTNRGDQDLIFTRGDTLKIYVRTNIPCWVRLLYRLADGSQALMVDNHFVDESRVNHVYQIPHLFQCAPPFGAEWLLALGRSEKFEPLNTQQVDGYEIVTERLDSLVSRTRGFQKIKPAMLQTERRLVITTMDR